MKQLSERQQKIVTQIALFWHANPKDFEVLGVSRSTFARDVEELIKLEFVSRSGKGPGTIYTQGSSFFLAPVIVQNYFDQDQDSRKINEHKIDFLKLVHSFSMLELRELESLGEAWYKKYQNAS